VGQRGFCEQYREYREYQQCEQYDCEHGYGDSDIVGISANVNVSVNRRDDCAGAIE
jgi:hypothetical protein